MSTRHGSSAEHTALVNACIKRLGVRSDVRVWKQGHIHQEMPGGGWLEHGVRGMSDLGGILNDGRVLSIECKTGNAKPTKAQRIWIAMVQSMGGVAGVVRSVEEAEQLIEQRQRTFGLEAM